MDKRLVLLQNEPGFDRLFGRFREKYRSVGRIGGSVKVEDFSRVELEAVAGFLGLSPDRLEEKRTVSLKKFEEQLSKTNLEGLSLKTLLELYFGQPLVSKAEERASRDEAERNFYEVLVQEFPRLDWWFQRMLQKKPDTRFIQVQFNQAPDELARLLRIVAKAFDQLPKEGQYERLPLFSQRVTGNPHSFDRNQTLGKLLLHLLTWNQVQEKDHLEASTLMPTEQINELLVSYGILRDDLWSFVTCRGFRAFKDTVEHAVWEAAARSGTVMNIPVRELTMIDSIKPYKGDTVWVLENSGVCSAIMDEVLRQPIVCTHGQFKVASWIFIERLVESGCTIYYSGDLDPEGLLMAQRLKSRFPENIKLWRMDAASYSLAISDEKIKDRLAQLKNLEDPELIEAASIMIEEGFAAYQEGLLELLIMDIRNKQD